jgi:uncharacterized protein YecT (DUF1311 family)
MQPIDRLRILALACGAGGLLASAAAIAQPAPNINCQNPASNVEYKYCARLAYEASDRELNQVYRRITGKMADDEKKVLTTAQLAWIRFRDTNCTAEVYQSRGGTGYGGFLSNCLERVTRARTAELQQQFENR